MASKSFLNLSLPASPATQDAVMHQELTKLYTSLQILANALDACQPKVIVEYTEDVDIGMMVNGYNVDNKLKGRKASALSASTYAIGYCTQSAKAGESGEIISFGIHPYISGLIPGTRYYLSQVSGLITPVAPSASGTIVQPIGFATSTKQLMFFPNLQLLQNP